MRDEDKSQRQLIEELIELRRRVAKREDVDIEGGPARAEDALRTAHEELERDVEERTAALIRANEELAIFRKFAETSAQGFSMADIDGYITYINPALCRMLGEERPEAVIGKHLSACFSEESNRKGKQQIRPALDSVGYWQGELPMLSRDGTSIPTWHHTFVIRDENGSPHRIAVVITDITERKQAEESLRQSHQHVQAVYDGMVDGFVIFDIEAFQIVCANAALCSMMGYSEEEIKVLTPEQKHPPEALPRIRAHYEEVMQGRESRCDSIPCIRKDGSIIYFDIVGKRVLFNGRAAALVFFHDVTQRRQARIALERERQTLEHMLRASDHERQLIAYDIHDGLAQQLAGGLMQFQIYDHLKATKSAEAQKAYDGGVMLLRQGHFEARRLISGVRPPILDESGVVAAIAHLVNEKSLEQGPAVEFQSKVKFNRLPPVLENVLYRIVQEGLSNATRHSKSEIVRIGLSQHEDRVRIEIRDWGVGFNPKKVQENRFGLEGIRERARLLGGTCKIRSKAGEGTSIVVELALLETRPEP